MYPLPVKPNIPLLKTKDLLHQQCYLVPVLVMFVVMTHFNQSHGHCHHFADAGWLIASYIIFFCAINSAIAIALQPCFVAVAA